MVERARHSRAVEDYLKSIYKLEQERGPVPTTVLAAELDRSPASVTNMIKNLATQGLVAHEPYHGVRLTPPGESAALRIIRRHRVIESYLIDRLGFTWDSVHEEAERLEHAASDLLVDRMALAVGDPDTDPHGAPIPAPDGTIRSQDLPALTELPTGAIGVIREVSDDDSERLRFLGDNGFLLGTEVTVLSASDEGGDVVAQVGGRRHRLAGDLAAAIRLEIT
ncbi:MAG: metal-dependent transcriptional regulator [marine benthic group bacterium]|jgi:DtxR family Mn-dependent transcriptional regulator|nr:metal-dependent transcriptional regulator [Gemmatimonadota bacterium]MCL7962699.1 metal-dependent transcriptional regulator [Candidatus Carthagonibacter metallireducens]MCL7957218.1 metal-dependent transcriptional regulator [Gemmatimonadota bacterium]MCL7965009.1 metal-dependent transcriptional regulator [Gemmatimonadota bacterium]MCL7966963.1 metal-dependent transcriptional regulator [Gemmatimonadota bacterium]